MFRRNCRAGPLAAAAMLLGTSFAPAQVIRSASGVDAASITPTRDQFRVDLGGGTTAGANGQFSDATGTRREINWDGVTAPNVAPNNLPANFFNVNSPRGAVFATVGAGTGFQVSSATTDTSPPPANFGNIDASYTGTFAPFSAQRLFTPLGNNVMDVNFFAAGTGLAGLTKGFGAVFTDVDLASTTTIQYFNALNVSLGVFNVQAPTPGSQTFSFLGVSFPSAVISRVRITTGNTTLASGATDQNGAARDVVVMDDFLYGEPVGVPEPSSLALLGLGAAGFTAWRRGRKGSK